MKVDFTQSSDDLRPVLPRQLAFSLTKLDDIFKRFNVEARSHDAQEQTLMDCQGAGVRGEEKHCTTTTSLESVVDFETTKLGEKAEAVTTEEAVKERRMQEYTIASGVEKVVACHRLEYLYAVFYYHKLEKRTAYTVPLEGADGMRVKAVAVYQANTQWHSKHMALRVLKVKPGTVAVCHFLPHHDNLVWVPMRLQIL